MFDLSGKFEPKRLTDFFKAEIREVDVGQFRIYDFLVCCPTCKSAKVILKEWRDNKRKGKVRRYQCKACGHKFSNSIRGHFPLEIIEAVLALAVKGLSPSDIADEIKRKNPSLRIVSQTVMNIIRRFVDNVLKFELKLRHRTESCEWQIDDTPHIFPKSEEANCSMGKPKFVWVTNVLAVNTRYWLSAHTSLDRSAEASYEAAKTAYNRGKYAPVVFRCDGYEGHVSGIRKAFPFVMIDSKSKAENFGHINLIENLHSFMRRKGIKKRGRFRSIKNLQYFVELLRIYYNFLHYHGALDTTPAAEAGIAPPFKSWGEFVRYIFRLSR